MANYGYVTTRCGLGPRTVWAALGVVLEERFGGNVVVREFEKPGWWRLGPKDGRLGWEWEFEVGLKDAHTLEFRHPHRDWAFWAQLLVQDALGLRLGGRVSDDAVDGSWAPALKRPTYRAWLENYESCFPRIFRAGLATLRLRGIPVGLRGVARSPRAVARGIGKILSTPVGQRVGMPPRKP